MDAWCGPAAAYDSRSAPHPSWCGGGGEDAGTSHCTCGGSIGAPSPPPLSSAANVRGATVVTHCSGRPFGNGALDSAPDSCASLAPQDESTFGRRLRVPPKSSTVSALSTHVSSATISKYALASLVRNGSFSSSCSETCGPSTQDSGGGAGGQGGGGGGGGGYLQLVGGGQLGDRKRKRGRAIHADVGVVAQPKADAIRPARPVGRIGRCGAPHLGHLHRHGGPCELELHHAARAPELKRDLANVACCPRRSAAEDRAHGTLPSRAAATRAARLLGRALEVAPRCQAATLLHHAAVLVPPAIVRGPARIVPLVRIVAVLRRRVVRALCALCDSALDLPLPLRRRWRRAQVVEAGHPGRLVDDTLRQRHVAPKVLIRGRRSEPHNRAAEPLVLDNLGTPATGDLARHRTALAEAQPAAARAAVAAGAFAPGAVVLCAGHTLLLRIAPLLTSGRLRVASLELIVALQLEPYLDPCAELPVWHARLEVKRAAELACGMTPSRGCDGGGGGGDWRCPCDICIAIAPTQLAWRALDARAACTRVKLADTMVQRPKSTAAAQER
eukprot:scaffold6552_cov61-Phaeocystis_antarctica.AAC.6